MKHLLRILLLAATLACVAGCGLFGTSASPDQARADVAAMAELGAEAVDAVDPFIEDAARVESALAVLRSEARSPEPDEEAVRVAVADILAVLRKAAAAAKAEGAPIPKEVDSTAQVLELYLRWTS